MVRTRVLCLGNELLADDGFAFHVGRRLRKRLLDDVEFVCTPLTGFHLLDHTADVSRLLVIDTVLTGTEAPGTIYQLREDDVAGTHAISPHFLGLFETLALGKQLGLPIAREVIIFAVEAADCFTVGGAMDPAVQASVPIVERLIVEFIQRWSCPQSQNDVFGSPARAIQ